MGTCLKEKEKNEWALKTFDPLYKELDGMSNMFFKDLTKVFSEATRKADSTFSSKEKNMLKGIGEEMLSATVKTNSESVKKTGSLKSEEEKFINNINKIISKFLD